MLFTLSYFLPKMEKKPLESLFICSVGFSPRIMVWIFTKEILFLTQNVLPDGPQFVRDSFDGYPPFGWVAVMLKALY